MIEETRNDSVLIDSRIRRDDDHGDANGDYPRRSAARYLQSRRNHRLMFPARISIFLYLFPHVSPLRTPLRSDNEHHARPTPSPCRSGGLDSRRAHAAAISRRGAPRRKDTPSPVRSAFEQEAAIMPWYRSRQRCARRIASSSPEGR